MPETLKPSAGPAPVDPLIGQTIGGAYQITRLLGQGGMGNVYEAAHVRLPKRFAIKIVKSGLARDEASFERFKREAEIASSLGNRHIVEVLDFNTLDDGSPYMVMEFLTGEDLATRLGKVGRLSPHEANQILGQVVSALDAAHARGIVHRDIKPENIFLTRVDEEDDFVKLLDFGLSKMRGSQKRLTANLSVLGTPWYMSPEQARGDADLDHRTDIYAMAVVLYQVLVGRVPFEGDNVYGVLTQIATQPPPPMRQFDPDLPETLDRVVLRALSKEPSARPGSVRELWEQVQAAMDVTVVRRSNPTVRVPGPQGEPFRVPTPSQLQLGHQKTVASSRDLPIPAVQSPIPLTRTSEKSKRSVPPPVASVAPGRISGPSPSMLDVQRAAFPDRARPIRLLAISFAVTLGVLGLGIGLWAMFRTPPAPVVVVPPTQRPEPKPALVETKPEPKPAVVEPKPEPKPAVVEAKPEPKPAVVEPKPAPMPVQPVAAKAEPKPALVKPVKAVVKAPKAGKTPKKKGGANDLIPDTDIE